MNRERVKERLVRDLHDAADARRDETDAIDDMADRLENGDINVREFVDLAKEYQVMLEVIPK
jgi:succinate dehydrogenase/fumarate reductase flavoprotein subunit